MKKIFASATLLLAVILMDILAGMEFDLFVPSFPELQDHFNLTAFWAEALLYINFAGYCLGLLFTGELGDRYGRRPVILTGITIFIIGSLLCWQAPSYPFLLVGRFLQGLGVAAPAILSFLIIADAYPLKQQQSYMAILNGLMNVSIGIAPVVGSYVTLYFHWQGNFSVLLWLAVVTGMMTVLFVHTTHAPRSREAFSLRGYVSLFHPKPVKLLIGHIIPQIVPYWIFVGMSPLLYMNSLGVSLAHFGYYQGSLAFLFAVGSLLSGLVVNRYERRTLLLLSAVLFILGAVGVCVVAFLPHPPPLAITLAFLPFVLGQILPSVILYPLCLNIVPQAKGRISALLHGGRLIFSGIGLQVAGYFYQGSFREIGLVLIVFMTMAIVTLCMILKNPELMTFSRG